MPLIGDFRPARSALEAAREQHNNRKKSERESDEARRAPITTDFQRWSENEGRFDFPGVDTPTDEPDVMAKDLMQSQQPTRTARSRGDTPADPLSNEQRSREETRAALQSRDVALRADDSLF